jgi:hypothetical protein
MELWVRALDGIAIADLAEEGVDLTPLFQTQEDNSEEITVETNNLQQIIKNRDDYLKIIKRLAVKFAHLERNDGSRIEFSQEVLEGWAGFPEMVGLIICCAFMAARNISGNSESSSDGNDSPTVQPNGEPTTETTESVV